MRLSCLSLAALLACSAVAWEQADYEIFDLVAALESSEGKGTSFYSFLNISAAASTSEISKQYRKRSLELHPDKNPDVKDAHERFARLGVIANILRDPTERKRYDHFYKNGVPRWVGYRYLYQRYRPGIIIVVAFLTMLSCGVQWLVQKLNFFIAKQRLDNIRRRAIQQAYGPNPSSKQKEQKRLRLKIPKTELAEDRNNAFLISVHGDNVYLCDETTKEEHLLDDSALPRPAIATTWLPALLLALVPGRKRPEKAKIAPPDPQDSDTMEDDATGVVDATSLAVPQTQTQTKKRKTGKR